MSTLAIITACLLMAGGVKTATIAVRHDHSRGHCGWAGCQQGEKP